MSRVRFATVRDLYSSFSTAATEVGEEASDEESIAFIGRSVSEGRPETALVYCAYLLPRREAVWWACQSMRDLADPRPAERECIALALEWALKPEESRRRRALDKGLETSPKLSGAWVALAAGWSGGSIAPAGAAPMPPSPAATAQAIRVALLSAAARLASDRKQAIMVSWVEAASRALQEGVQFG
jgi:hypothetical protein